MKHKSTVLIVDDDAIGRQTLEALLISQGYDLAFASNGVEALEQAAKLKPDVILLDIMMPGMNGFEVCQRLRADPMLANVPVIILTTLDDRESRLRGIEAGADEFLSRPFDRNELRVRIRTITRLNRYRQLMLERSKFEWVVEQADDAYLVLGKSDDVLYANPQARRYLNLSNDETEPVTETFMELAIKWYRCQPDQAWSNWPDGRSAQSPLYLVRSDSADNGALWLRVELMEMTSRSEEKYLVRLRDITELVASQRATWTFQTQICHKLRTPLALLTGVLSVLEEDEAGLSEEKKKSILAMAHRNAKQLQDEIQEILQYVEAPEMTQPGRGHCALSQIPEMISEIAASLELHAEIRLDGDGVALEEQHVPISRDALDMVTWEILENSKKFHPHGSPSLEIKIAAMRDAVRIQFIDDGLRLPPEKLTKIWHPYYQAERNHSGQIPGLGLGLATVASLVWELGGSCHAYNREDKAGIIIELVLPTVQVDSGDVSVEGVVEYETIT